MTKIVITENQKNALENFLNENHHAELINTYLRFLEIKFNLHPIVLLSDKMIYQSEEEAVKHLEDGGRLWRETEIKIGFSNLSVNEQTKKIYICPFTGKVFGDNTHPNPQDAIYDWVSKCPENTERVGGLRVKRFYVSEDPDVIKSYYENKPKKEPITKVVFSSVLSGKLFNSKHAVIEDFKKNYLKPISLVEMQNQNRFQIDEKLLDFIQNHLAEDKISAFVEALADFEVFVPYIEEWIDSDEQ